MAGCSSDSSTEEPTATAGAAGAAGGVGGVGGSAGKAGGSGGVAGKAQGGAGQGGAGAAQGGAGQGGAGAAQGGAGMGGAGAAQGGAGMGGAGQGGDAQGGAGQGGDAQGGAGQGGAGQGGAGMGGGSSCGPVTGDGNVTKGTLIPAPAGFTVIDATPGPDGCTVFFTAADENGGASVFSGSIGGTPKALNTNFPFVYPVGVAATSDGQTLFVADLGAIPDPMKTTEGAIFTLSTAGSGAEILGGTGGRYPRGLVIVKQGGSDVIFFTGVDADGQPGVFQVPAGSGTVTTVVKGAPFVDPGGIAVTAAGHVYVTDHGAAPGGAIIDVSGTTAKVLTQIKLGSYPAGIALSADETQLLVSGEGAKGGSGVAVLDAASGAQKSVFTTGLEVANEPGGLHRATGADVFSLVNGMATGGGVFVLTP
jgi:hypothetical protein